MPKTKIPTVVEPERPDVWNYTRTTNVARTMLGPHARVWHRAGELVRIGLEHGSEKVVLGEGSTFLEAVEAAFLEPIRKLEELRRLEAEAEAEAVETIMKAGEPAETITAPSEPSAPEREG